MKGILAELLRVRAAVVGLVIIGLLLGLAAYAVVTIPYREAIRLWQGGEALWVETPRNARPAWFNWFRSHDLPPTIAVDSRRVPPRVRSLGSDVTELTIPLAFEYSYDRFPQEVSIFFETAFRERGPFVELTWVPPNGTEIRLTELAVNRLREPYRLSADATLRQTLGGPPERVLFADPQDAQRVLPGRHELRIKAFLFEPEASLQARLIVYGEVYGLAGTDHQRRDLMVALLWGTPIAMAFGLLAAVGTTFSTLIIAAIGAWYGRWLDGVIQRITEVNLILPILPILIMIGTLYSRSIWVILGVIILLSIFGAGIKTYRALFLQVKESPYVEAARAYGAGNLRTVFSYLVPRAVPVLVPQFVTLIPAFVFLEATLAVLGLGDPILPTWGKVMEDAYSQGALFTGNYYWVLEPAVLLMLSGLGFTMLGFALDRIFNPRLREM